jgi:hypothetical protein
MPRGNLAVCNLRTACWPSWRDSGRRAKRKPELEALAYQIHIIIKTEASNLFYKSRDVLDPNSRGRQERRRRNFFMPPLPMIFVGEQEEVGASERI